MGTISQLFSFPNVGRALLALIALANLYRITDKPLDANRAVDFRNVYVGQLLLTEGENPYDDALLKARWKQITLEEGIEWVSPNIGTSEPGFPDNPLVYPPWALGLFAPFSAVGFSVGHVIWYGLIGGMLLVFIWGIFVLPNSDSAANGLGTVPPNSDSAGGERVKSVSLRNGVRRYKESLVRRCKYEYLDLLLLTLAFKGTVHAFIVCQPTFLCFAAIGGFLWAFYQDKKLLAGFFLAIAAFKVSLVIPFVLWVLLKKEWRVLLAATGTGVVMWGLAIMMVQDPMAMHQVWLETMGKLSGLVFDSTQPEYPIYFTMTQITELGTLMEYVVEGGSAWRGWVYAAIWIGLIPFLVYRISHKNISDLEILILLCIALFLTTYHQFYDLLLLLLLYPFMRNKAIRSKVILLLIMLPLFLPVNGILNRLGIPESLWFLYFTTPLVVLALGVWALISMGNPQKRAI